jgi:hypothetical protein
MEASVIPVYNHYLPLWTGVLRISSPYLANLDETL